MKSIHSYFADLQANETCFNMDVLTRLVLMILLAQKASMKDIKEYEYDTDEIDQVTYNESLKMFNEAKKDVHEIKEGIKKTVSEIDKNVEIQNKVIQLCDLISINIYVDHSKNKNYRRKYLFGYHG